jgi:lysylphosphatidylglycerol synthetase-like protein (DUF2156 family)
MNIFSSRRNRADATLLREEAMKQTDRMLRAELVAAAKEHDLLAIELRMCGY